MTTLRQLYYFSTVAEVRHFGKAAERCCVTQPALSMQIAQLEETLGVPLIERQAGRFELTGEGQEIARRAGTILAAVRDLEDYARHRLHPLTGELRLGVIPSIAPYLLPRILPALQTRFPALSLKLRETMTQTLVDELLRGSLDALLLALPIEHPDIETLALFDDRFLVARQAAPGASRPETVSAGDIAGETLLLLEEGHCLRDQTLSYCKGVQPDVLSSFGASSLATILQMVANGYGITLLPEMAAESEAADARISLARFRSPEPSRSIGLAWRKTSPRKQDFTALAELIGNTRHA